MDNIHGILVFIRIVEAGSLSAAARAMGVSTSAVSAALARLINRTTRRLIVTDEGAKFYDRCKRIVADLEHAEQEVAKPWAGPAGTLKVGMPSTLGHRWIAPELARFTEAYPDVTLDVVCTDFVPFTVDPELDVCVQIGELQNSNFAVRRLARSDYLICAAPAYLAEHGAPETPADLAAHRCLNYRRPRNGRIREWEVTVEGYQQSLQLDGRATMNSHEALIAAAISGMGLVQVAEYYAHDAIARGELTEVLAGHRGKGYTISALFSKRSPFPPKVRVFIDFLTQVFRTPPWVAAPEEEDKELLRQG